MVVLDLRKNYIIFNIVMVTNVFSSGGINSWILFRFRSLCGSRLMNYQTTFTMFRRRTSNRNWLDKKGLYGSSPVSLLCFPFLGWGSIISGGFGLALSGFGLSCSSFLKF